MTTASVVLPVHAKCRRCHEGGLVWTQAPHAGRRASGNLHRPEIRRAARIKDENHGNMGRVLLRILPPRIPTDRTAIVGCSGPLGNVSIPPWPYQTAVRAARQHRDQIAVDVLGDESGAKVIPVVDTADPTSKQLALPIDGLTAGFQFVPLVIQEARITTPANYDAHQQVLWVNEFALPVAQLEAEGILVQNLSTGAWTVLPWLVTGESVGTSAKKSKD